MNKVTYKCQDCGKEFEVNQGSRQRYCPECIAAKVAYKDKKTSAVKEEEGEGV